MAADKNRPSTSDCRQTDSSVYQLTKAMESHTVPIRQEKQQQRGRRRDWLPPTGALGQPVCRGTGWLGRRVESRPELRLSSGVIGHQHRLDRIEAEWLVRSSKARAFQALGGFPQIGSSAALTSLPGAAPRAPASTDSSSFLAGLVYLVPFYSHPFLLYFVALLKCN